MAVQLQEPEAGEERPYDEPDIGQGYDDNPYGQGSAANDPSDPRGEGADGLGSVRQGEAAGDSLYNPNDASEESPGELADQEDTPDDQLGKGYNPKGSNTKKGVVEFTKRHRQKMAIGGGIFAIGGGVGVGVFLLLLPLKIEHIVNNLQSHFFASSLNATQRETDKMLIKYVVKYVLPDYKNCGTTLSKKCRVSIVAGPNNPVTNMYRGWAQARLENSLAGEPYNLEFRFDKASDTWHFKAPGTSPEGDVIGKNGEKLDSVFKEADRAGMRQAMHDAADGLTFRKKIMFRYSVGRLLEEKYGVMRCIIYCGKRDALGDKKAEKVIAAKIYLTQRVIAPRNQTVAIALECLLSNCDATDTSPGDASSSPAEGDAPENDEVDGKVRQTLGQLAAKYGSANVADVAAEYAHISDRGFQRYLTDKALTPLLGDIAAGKVTDAIPIAGWINLASQIVEAGNKAGPQIKKLRYVPNAAAAVSLYMMYRTYADEIHTGHVDATEVGSMVNSFGPGDHGGKNDPIVGGTAGAENTPLYQTLIDGGGSQSGTTALLNGILPSKAYAAAVTPTSNDYKCDNGKPVPAGQLICSEESFGGGLSFTNNISDFLKKPGVNVISTLAGLWKDSIGQAFNLVSGVLGPIFAAADKAAELSCKVPLSPGIPPGYCKAKKLVNSGVKIIADGVTKTLLPSPFSTNMSGGRNFDMTAAGADVAGNDYAHTRLGGQVLTPLQSAEITNEQENEARQSFRTQPLFARIFSTDSPYSLVSKVAMATPIGTGAAVNSGMASLLNPLGALSHGFSSVFTGRAGAVMLPQKDVFGVTQYGYPNVPEDPETYWNEACTDDPSTGYSQAVAYDFKSGRKVSAYSEAAAQADPDESTGMPVNTTSNPCLLIKATTGQDGGAFDTSLLTPDDLNIGGGTSSATSTQPTDPTSTGTPPSGSAQDLAKQLIPFIDKGQVKCGLLNSINKDCSDIRSTASGNSIKGRGGCAVDGLQPALLGMLLKLLQMGHTFSLTAVCSDHHLESGRHSAGLAADFGIIDGVSMTGTGTWGGSKLSAGKKLDEDVASFMPKSTEFLQQQCHGTFSFLSGFKGANITGDPCHHQHITAGS